MEVSSSETPDVIWNRRTVKERLAGQTNRVSHFYLLCLLTEP